MEFRLVMNADRKMAGLVVSESNYRSVQFQDKVLYEPFADESSYTYVFDVLYNKNPFKYVFDFNHEACGFVSNIKDIDQWVQYGLIKAIEHDTAYNYEGENVSIKLTVYA